MGQSCRSRRARATRDAGRRAALRRRAGHGRDGHATRAVRGGPRDFRAGPRPWTVAGSSPGGPGVRVDTVGRGRPLPTSTTSSSPRSRRRRDRAAAIDRLRRAPDETEIAGIQTTLPFTVCARHEGFRGGCSTDWVAGDGTGRRACPVRRGRAAAAAEARTEGRSGRSGSVGSAEGLVGPGGTGARPPGPRPRIAGRDDHGPHHRPDGAALADLGDADQAGRAPRRRRSGRLVLAAATPSRRGRTAVEVVVAGWRFEFEVEAEARAYSGERATGAVDATAHDGPTEVRAIIPGRVVSVAVVAGTRWPPASSSSRWRR